MRQKGGERSAPQIRFSTKWQLCCPWGTVRIAIIKMAPATYALLMDPHLSIFLLASSTRLPPPPPKGAFCDALTGDSIAPDVPRARKSVTRTRIRTHV